MKYCALILVACTLAACGVDGPPQPPATGELSAVVIN
jgi:predicted small lipoprotein YifL